MTGALQVWATRRKTAFRLLCDRSTRRMPCGEPNPLNADLVRNDSAGSSVVSRAGITDLMAADCLFFVGQNGDDTRVP